jgi:hypothetical protein
MMRYNIEFTCRPARASAIGSTRWANRSARNSGGQVQRFVMAIPISIDVVSNAIKFDLVH